MQAFSERTFACCVHRIVTDNTFLDVRHFGISIAVLKTRVDKRQGTEISRKAGTVQELENRTVPAESTEPAETVLKHVVWNITSETHSTCVYHHLAFVLLIASALQTKQQ